jgi:hypothetical protein
MNSLYKIVLPSHTDFNFKDCSVGGDECWLITPKTMAVQWNETNFRFRSTILRKSDGAVVSQGFGKFTNFGEQPNFQPWDTAWDIKAVHKIDGSLLIVSKHNDTLIVRTRGTVDARTLPNGHEIDSLIKQYPNVFDNNFLNDGYSILLEWTTPTNIIVLREHSTPTLTLVGMIFNASAQYQSQESLDSIAKIFEVGRPVCYNYHSVEECILDVDAWTGKEGVVLYSPDGQTLKKIKAAEYCMLHKIATGIKSIYHVMDLFLASPRFTSAADFYNYIQTTIDYEIAEKIKDDIKNVVASYNIYLKKLDLLRGVIDELSYFDSRREQAKEIILRFHDWRRPAAFSLLDNKTATAREEAVALQYELETILNKL